MMVSWGVLLYSLEDRACPFCTDGNIGLIMLLFASITKCNMKAPGNSQVMQFKAWDVSYLINPDREPRARPPRVHSPGGFGYFQQLFI